MSVKSVRRLHSGLLIVGMLIMLLGYLCPPFRFLGCTL